MKWNRRDRIIVRVVLCAFLLAAITAQLGFISATRAATVTSKVAYVYDDTTGVSGVDGNTSIFTNALCSTSVCPPSGFTAGPNGTATYKGVAFTDVPVSSIDASGSTALSGYDTLLLYEVCTIGGHATTMSAVKTFLANGGKVLIFDADRCYQTASGAQQSPDYGTFTYPFTTSNPGPIGSGGSYTFVEQSTLTTGLTTGSQAGDSVGDANAFVTYNGAWCGSITGINDTGKPGFVQAYARGPNGSGLVIYEGEDFWATGSGNAGDESGHLQLVFDNLLNQSFNPDGLPCSLRASGISLGPPSASQATRTQHTDTATVADVNGTPQSGVTVTFTIVSGPDKGMLCNGQPCTAATGTNGQADFSFTSNTAGTDVVVATYTDANGKVHTSNQASVQWMGPTAARVARFTVHRSAGTIIFHWRIAVSTDVVGFELYAGRHRLNHKPIAPHRGRAYHFRATWTGDGPFALDVELVDGRHLRVLAGHSAKP